MVTLDNVPDVYFAEQILQCQGLVFYVIPKNNKRDTAVKHIFRQSHIFVSIINGHKFRKAQRVHMDFIPTAGKLRYNIFGQELRVASGYKNIHVVLAKITIQHRFKAVHQLYFIQKQVVHPIGGNFRTNIRHEFFRVNAALFLLDLDQAFANQIQVVGRVKSKTNNMVGRDARIQQMAIENMIHQIGLSTSVNAGNDLNESIVLSFN